MPFYSKQPRHRDDRCITQIKLTILSAFHANYLPEFGDTRIAQRNPAAGA